MSSIGNLRMFVDPDAQLGRKHTPWDDLPSFRDFQQIQSGDNVFDAAGYCIHLALAIHESRSGREAMAKVGRSVIREWNRDRVPHIYTDRTENMIDWVDVFLAAIRRDFPNFYITGTLPGEGQTRRMDWRGTRLTDFDPKAAANVFIQRWKVDIIIYSAVKHGQYLSERRTEAARQAGYNWDTAVWSLTKTIAHELLHVFVGYLMGGAREITPPRSTHPGYGDSSAGESGRMWEGILLGGIPAFIEDTQDRLGDHQAGIPYLTDIEGHDRCKKVSQNWVADFARGNLHFPAALSTSAHSLRQRELFRDREMSQVRTEAMKRGVPRELIRQGFSMDRSRGRADASRRDMERINRAPVFTFRPSRYPVPAMV